MMSSIEITPFRSPSWETTGSRRSRQVAILPSTRRMSSPGRQVCTLRVMASCAATCDALRRRSPTQMAMSRSVRMPTTRDMPSSTGSMPQSNSFMRRLAVARSVSRRQVCGG
jgi:hypothetical protein